MKETSGTCVVLCASYIILRRLSGGYLHVLHTAYMFLF